MRAEARSSYLWTDQLCTDRTAKLLSDLLSLREGWDGEDAAPPAADAVLAAAEVILISDLPSPVRIAPAVSGGVLVEWNLEGHYQEAEVDAFGLVEWMREIAPGVYDHWESRVDLALEPQTWTLSVSSLEFDEVVAAPLYSPALALAA